MGQPDVQSHVLWFMVGWADRAPVEKHGIAIGPCFLRPKSLGTVRLRSSSPKDRALFDAGSFSDPDDLEVLVRGVLLGIKILEQPSLAKLIKRHHLPEPGIKHDPAALRSYVRQTAKTVFHPGGTAKMGPDTNPMATVDHQLRVRGVTGLRVAGGSAPAEPRRDHGRSEERRLRDGAFLCRVAPGLLNNWGGDADLALVFFGAALLHAVMIAPGRDREADKRPSRQGQEGARP